MELSGVVSRRIPCLPGRGTAAPRRSWPRVEINVGLRWRSRNLGAVSVSSGFRDDGHVKYYSEGARCGGGVGKAEKGVGKNAKKRLKLVKGLYKELSRFSQMGFGIDEEGGGLVAEVQGKRVSPVDVQEAAGVLLAQLEQLKAEEKEMKRRRKQPKAILKAERMKRHTGSDSSSSSSSSSSSDSSDSEADEVIDMKRLRTESPAQNPADQPLPITQGTVVPHLPSTSESNDRPLPLSQGMAVPVPSLLSTIGSSVTERPNSPSNTSCELAKKIEVCMGGKCKKSGGAAILEELQKAVGIEGAVVGCKCMGKCRDGPNVRFCSGARAQREGVGSSATDALPVNPLCIGVGLDDVGLILSNFLGTQQSGLDVGFSAGS